MSLVRIAHLSDPHFGQLNPGADVAMLRFLHQMKPDMVLISGDITQRARRSQFIAAKAFMDKLAPILTFAIPGNHDIPLENLPLRFTAPYHGYHKYFQTRREAQFMFGDVSVTGLNSTSRWRHVQGALTLERIRLPLERSSKESRIRVVSIHHPMDCAKHVDEKNLIKNRDEVAHLLAETRTDLILSGHIHDPYVELSSHRYPGVARSMIISVAGTCLSSRTRAGAPNSFNWIEIASGSHDTIQLTRMDLAKDGDFRPVEKKPDRFLRNETGSWSRSGG